MKKVLVIMVVILLNNPANAGFWSSIAGGVVANSITSSGSHSKGNNIDAKTDEKKIQQVLTKLGLYDSNIDGNLNSFESREAISKFQKLYFAKETGKLTDQSFQDLLYMHDLFKKYKTEFKQASDANSGKLEKIYDAFDKLEANLRNRNMSFFQSAKFLFSKPITSIRTKLEADFATEKVRQEFAMKKFGLSKDYQDLFFDDMLVWQDIKGLKENTKTWDEANEYCETLKLGGGSGWRLPTISELSDLFDKRHLLKHKETNEYWSSNTGYYNDGTKWFKFFKFWFNRYMYMHTDKATRGKASVRCVKDKL